MNEFKQSIETYNAIKESYGAIWTSKAKGKQTSELELSDFIGRIKDAWPLMFAQEQRRELRGMVIVVNNLIDYMQTVRGKQLFRGMDFSLQDVLNPKPTLMTLEMLEEAAK